MEENNDLCKLPKGWVWTTLGEALDYVKGKKPKNVGPKNEHLTIPYINIKAFEYKVFTRFTDGDDCRFCEPSEVLIVWDGARCGLVGRGVSGAIGSTLAKLIGYELNSAYLFYFLQSQYGHINTRPKGVGIPHIDPSVLWNIAFPLPPISEQDRIVVKIEELFTQLDAGVAALEKAKAQLRHYRQAVLKAAVEGELTREWREAHQGELEPASVLLERILEERRARWEAEQLAKMEAKGKSPKNDRWKRKYKEPALPDTEGLPELPEGWCYTSLAPLLSMHRSGMKTGPFGSLLKKHEHRAEGVPVLGIENVEPMRFVHGNKIHVTEEKAAQLSAYDVQANDILISRSGTVGQVCVVPEGLGEARMSTNLMRVVLARDGMLPHFFSLLFNGSPFVLAQVSELCSGSTRDFLNQKILSSVVFSGPPLAEQQRIVSEVERRLSVADEMEKAVEQSLKRAERLRQSILKRAFEGKLVPQDPSDEPASVLLERIRAKKARREGERKDRGKGSRRKKQKAAKQRQLEMFTQKDPATSGCLS